MKEGGTLAKNLKSSAKEVCGTCKSMGVTVEEIDPRQAIKHINEGKFDSQLET